MPTDEEKPLTNTLDRPVNPSLTLGIIRIWVGACEAISLKAKTCQTKYKRRKDYQLL